jgi:hypothetical protein
MASTTFTDNQTVIYADWLNDVNNAVYNGVFAATTITPTNLVCNGSVSGTGFTSLVSNVFSAPSPIGSATPNTGAFTTLTATTPIGAASGGTGRSSLTSNYVLLGNGTSAVQQIAPGTANNVLISDGTTWASSAGSGIAKAWVNFNGSTGTIISSYGVTSITQNATGDFTVNFTTAFSDANYVILGSARNTSGQPGISVGQNYLTTQTTTSCRLYCINDGGGAFNSPYISAVFFR